MKLKKILNAELENIVPNMSENVKNAPFPTNEIVEENKKSFFKTNAFRMVTAFALSLVLICLVILPFALKGGNGGYTYNENSVICLEVNPKIKLVANGNDEIVSVSSSNTDADVILIEDGLVENLKGKKISDGLEILIEKCVEYGFISDETEVNAVSITVSNENSDKSSSLENELKGKISQFVNDNNLSALVSVSSESLKNTAEKLGFSYQTASDFISQLNNVIPLEIERNVTITDEDFNKNYTGEFKKFATETVENYYKIMLSKKSDLQTLEVTLQQVKDKLNEEFNIGVELDYWVIKELDFIKNQIHDKSLQFLLNEADKKIIEFKNKYDIEIDSIITFTALSEIYNNLDVASIYLQILNHINSAHDQTEFNALISEISLLIPDDALTSQLQSNFEKFTERPSNVDEYMQKSKDMIKEKAQTLKRKAQAGYNDKFQKNKN